eukprot:CAMPEP_0177545768 /NCGR_PEP_ID=MMETSP0369-20130122/62817_1 /TAXON_ID=447022 ORGANISM="Scrippsiella hangoei-like, Strain SHHI-4" /NCGR_SAMPLE_ID=MMETSP0369 /ASSEMBLY_ACC=CAM_ASM_000364 /LENGTH=51 /DNA_ID=CAMNT_0019030129 /DNA_START=12 /DNA_END=165 /DNA_ORIENTATION=+
MAEVLSMHVAQSREAAERMLAAPGKPWTDPSVGSPCSFKQSSTSDAPMHGQ